MARSAGKVAIGRGATGRWAFAQAFVVFAVLLAVVAGIAFQVGFRNVSRLARATRVSLVVSHEAEAVAGIVRSIGSDGNGAIDYSRLRRGLGDLSRLLCERLDVSRHLRSIEIRDRFGAPVISEHRAEAELDPLTGERLVPGPSDSGRIQVVIHPLRNGIQSEGEIRLGISEDAINREVDQLRRGLQLKVGIATAVVAAILVAGMFYVLYLMEKNQRLEESKLAAERSAYKGLLASGLAHEIRNPLNAMKMNLQMLDEELQDSAQAGDAEMVELLASTQSEIKRLENLVNNFLLYARPSPPTFREADINAVLREIATFLAADFRQSGVELDLDLEPLLPSVQLDASKLKQALMNVLVNARQVLKSGGKVVVRSRPSGAGEVLVEIQDNGPGMDAETAAKIFLPFFSQRAGGTGLGLSIAKLMVEQHRGSIELDTLPGRGTTFRIRLPRRAGQGGPVFLEAPEARR